MIFPGCEANTDVNCLQVIAKKEVTPKSASALISFSSLKDFLYL